MAAKKTQIVNKPQLYSALFFLALGALYVRPENWSPFAPNGLKGISSAAAVMMVMMSRAEGREDRRRSPGLSRASARFMALQPSTCKPFTGDSRRGRILSGDSAWRPVFAPAWPVRRPDLTPGRDARVACR